MAPVRIGPDLVVATLTVPAVAGPGSTISVTETTKNQGAGHSAASSTRFYLSANSHARRSRRGARNAQCRRARPGDRRQSAAITPVTIPTNVPSGTFYVIAVADDGNGGPGIQRDQQQPLRRRVRVGADLYVAASGSPPRARVGRNDLRDRHDQEQRRWRRRCVDHRLLPVDEHDVRCWRHAVSVPGQSVRSTWGRRASARRW